MDSDYIQHIRYKLQKRLRRLNTSSQESFLEILKRTWGFLQDNEVTKGVLDDLEKRISPETRDWAETILKNEGTITGITELENDGICYWVVKLAASASYDHTNGQYGFALLDLVQNISAQLDPFRESYVEPLFDYIDEEIDDKRMILALLRKYKHRSEWFRKEQLIRIYNDNTQQGERMLVADLYEYLHDQGIQFHIEPQSESGRADLISNQSGKDRLLADAKIFNPQAGHNRNYIVKGFRQVYDYAKDFNETFGYLIIFKICSEDLSIPTKQQEFGIPYVSYNNKTIFVVVIDICPYTESASKRGQLKKFELLPSELIESITDV